MKKLLTAAALLFSVISYAQDSTKVTINVQARDLEYIGSFSHAIDRFEELNDSIKVKFRVATPPTGNTPVSITAYTLDWVNLLQWLNDDHIALKSNTTKRVNDLLVAINQPYLNSKITAIARLDADMYTEKRIFGRNKLRRTR